MNKRLVIHILAIASGMLVASGVLAGTKNGPTATDVQCIECIEEEELEPNSVDTSKIVDGTIVNGDVSATAAIAANKLQSTVMVQGENVSLLNNDAGYITTETNAATLCLGGEVLTGDGSCQPYPFPGRTMFLSGDGAAAENGTALIMALTTLAEIVPSADAPYLLKLGPGVYDVGTSAAEMVSHTHIEGSGEGITVIRGTGSEVLSGNPLLNAEVRYLTVENSGGGDAVKVTLASINLSHVTARTNATSSCAVWVRGGSGANLSHVTAVAEASGSWGVCVSVVVSPGLAITSGATLSDVIASGDGGLSAGSEGTGLGVTVRNSELSGTTQGAARITGNAALPDSVTARFATSKLSGGVVYDFTEVDVKCVGSFDENYDPLTAGCF